MNKTALSSSSQLNLATVIASFAQGVAVPIDGDRGTVISYGAPRYGTVSIWERVSA